MDFRNRVGLYGAYFLGMAGIGFTLPYLPVYLSQKGLSDRAIGLVSTLAALAGLAQFPIGLWSDRVGRRRPFLVAVLAVLAAATVLLPRAEGVWLFVLVMLFAENGLCRATAESMTGAEATHQAPPGEVGRALGALRFWRPVSIITVALGGGFLAERYGVGSVLMPLAVVQSLAVAIALLIHGDRGPPLTDESPASAASSASPFHAKEEGAPIAPQRKGLRDRVLWVFVAAMVLFHVGNAPGGVYLGLYLSRELGASNSVLSYAFVISMVTWMLAVRPAGRFADRLGRKPLLVGGWVTMTTRLALIALARNSEQVLAIQVLDGLAQALFAVAAAAWVTDRLADPRRVGEAQVLVGSALVFGSAVGPLLSSLVVEYIGYRGTFGLLAGVGAVATALIVFFVPESSTRQTTRSESALSVQSSSQEVNA